LSCNRANAPLHTPAEYAELKRNISGNATAMAKLKKAEDREKGIAMFAEAIASCKSKQCRFDESVGEALCYGGDGTNNAMFPDGKGCNNGEAASKPVDGPTPKPAAPDSDVLNYLGKNCQSGKCHWNEKTNQAVCGLDPANSTPNSKASVKSIYHGLVVSAVLCICLIE